MESDLPPDLARIIDQIERVRARNNTLWCDLIRLVYRVAPEEGKALFREIERNDEEIQRLGKESARL